MESVEWICLKREERKDKDFRGLFVINRVMNPLSCVTLFGSSKKGTEIIGTVVATCRP